MRKTFYPWFSFHISVDFVENELWTKFFDVFDHFSAVYEVTKF